MQLKKIYDKQKESEDKRLAEDKVLADEHAAVAASPPPAEPAAAALNILDYDPAQVRFLSLIFCAEYFPN